MKLSGNTILITGGASGIGKALARLLVEKKNRVLICGRRADMLAQAKAQIPSLETMVCDLSIPGGRRALVEWALRVAPSLNFLINNAGVQRPINILAGDPAAPGVYEEIAINLEAPIHLCELLSQHLVSQGHAAILNISSGLGFTPLASVPVYGATKAALHSFSLSLRHQLRHTSVKVFESVPPIVRTELQRSSESAPDGPHAEAGTSAQPPSLSAEEFAAMCLAGVAEDRYTHAVGLAATLYDRRDALFERINPP